MEVSMSDWTYKIPDTQSAPGHKGSVTSMDDVEAKLYLGLYCEEPSHEGRPWFVGSFHPSYDVYRLTGKISWTFSADYPTGEGCLIRLTSKVPQMHMDESGQRGRWAFECQECGYRVVYKSETFQTAAGALSVAGFREISLTGLNSAISRLKVSTGSK